MKTKLIALTILFSACSTNFSCSKSQPDYMKRVVINVAGSFGGGYVDATGKDAKFNSPVDVAVDRSGNIFVADGKNSRIRRITPSGEVSTFAGNGAIDWVDAEGVHASFLYPFTLVFDKLGNLYVSDGHIRKISTSGQVSTIGTHYSYGGPLTDGPLSTATFSNVGGIAVDDDGNIYFSDGDALKCAVRKISSSGIVTTMAGGGSPGFSNGTRFQARFDGIPRMAVDLLGNVYVVDQGNNRIRKITPEGLVSTFAGSGKFDFGEGIGENASFAGVKDIALDGNGNMFACDNANIYKISGAAEVSRFAGSNDPDYSAGQFATEAKFRYPQGLAVDRQGHVYVADTDNQLIRMIK